MKDGKKKTETKIEKCQEGKRKMVLISRNIYRVHLMLSMKSHPVKNPNNDSRHLKASK